MNDCYSDSSQQPVSYNWNIARDFPQLQGKIIDRTHLLETIIQVLSEETPVVFLEGEEGYGATTTLAQFCKAYPDCTFSLFIKPASRFAYNLDYLRLSLYEQFHWYLHSTATEREFIDVTEYESLFLKIRRKKRASTLYFVIDGLHQIPSEDQRLVEQIIREVLPVGIDNFRFLISGTQAQLGKFVKQVGTKPYQQLKFSPPETEEYLSDLGLPPSDTLEIGRLCKGVPGRLASVKRLIQSGVKLSSILDSEPSKYPEFIRLEFESLDSLSIPQQTLIAVLAFGKRALADEELVDVAGADKTDLETVKQNCLFLASNAQTKMLEFVSESHRRFAEKRLEPFQKNSISLQVNYLLRNPDSPMALTFLPTYYQQLNQQQAIVDLLSTEHYAKLFETTQSITSLKNRAEMGAKSATLLRQATEVFKFALQRSIFIAVANRDGLESEIGALVAMGQSQHALALASKATAKEDRLCLLAAYARRVKEKNGAVEPEIVNYIQEIASQIDFGEYGDKAMDIAADVLFVDPDLAVSIVELASKHTVRPEDRDAAFAHLSFTASISKLSNKSSVDDKARHKISDEALQKLANSFAVIASEYSTKEIIRSVEQMEAQNRLYFLKNFILFRQEQKDILDVVEYALDLMIRDATYTPKSRDLAELARPLPHATEQLDRLKNVIKRFESQLGLIQNASLSKDLVVLQMRLARAEILFDKKQAIDRIERTYYEVASLKNPEIQTECYALMLRSLSILDNDGELEKAFGYRSLIKKELTEVLDNVLEHTAGHFHVVRGALHALAQYDAKTALDLADRLNTEKRREHCYREVARIVASRTFSADRGDVVTKAIKKITHSKKRADAILALVDAVAHNRDKNSWIETVVALESQIDVPELACEFAIVTFEIEADVTRVPNFERFDKRFGELIEQVDSKLVRIDLNFKAVEALAKWDQVAAARYYEIARQIKQGISPNSLSAADIFVACLALLLRVLSPIMKSGQANDELFARFGNIVEMIPCAFTRGRLYAELAIRAWCVGKNDLCRVIIQKYCNPTLEVAKASSSDLYKQLAVVMFPALHCVHQPSAFTLLSTLHVEEKDSALHDTAMIILRKLPPSDPYYNDALDRCKISHEDVLDILQLMERIETDSELYDVLESLIRMLCDKENKLQFTKQQKADYASRIRGLIEGKLPDPRNILHAGYKVAALAQAYQLEDIARETWETLFKEAEGIANIADRGFVFIAIAGCLPSKYLTDRKRFLGEALKLFNQIPSLMDRLTRLVMYSKAASNNAVGGVKEVLRNAVMLSLEIDNQEEGAIHQRQLIDIADKIEPGFADELVELIDDDPARAHAKVEMRKSAAVAKAKRQIANAKDAKEAGKLQKEHLPDAAWKNVAALLAGRLETKSPEVMTEYVYAAGSFALADAFPVLAWYLENSARRFLLLSDIEEQLLPICEALLLSTEMAATVIAHSSTTSLDMFGTIELDPSDGPMVRPRDREQAIQYVRQWLRANAVGYIKYCDAYFGPDDLQFLCLVLSESPSCKVSILTSKKMLRDKNALSSDVFLEHWNRLMQQDPPETEIVAIGSDGDEKILIHDRWILTKGAGLRIGTSFNSLGHGKLSEISEMEPAKAAVCEHHLNKFFAKERVIDGARVSYTSFTL